MEAFLKKHEDRLANIDAKIAKLQDERLASLEALMSDGDAYFKARDKENERKIKDAESAAKAILDEEAKANKNAGNGKQEVLNEGKKAVIEKNLAALTAEQAIVKFKAEDIKALAKEVGLKATGGELVVAQRLIDAGHEFK
jgi:hypothetical protein